MSPKVRRGLLRGQATGRSGGAALQCASRINHVVGDWGVVGAEEAAHNDESLKDGGLCCPPTRPIHAARAPGMAITRCGSSIEAVRSATTFLVPDESPGARV
jgi:hypothetical protein